MSQILDPVPNHEKNSLLCCYVNATSQIQVARITNIPNWYFERVVFPGQRLMFEAVPDALLEIHTGMMASAILSDTIPCERLCLDKKEDSPSETSTKIESQTTEQQEPGEIQANNQSTSDQSTSDRFKTTVIVS